MPCYVVRDTKAVEGQPKDRLVEAPNQAAARNFVVRDRFKVEQAQPAEIAKLVGSGVPYEVASGADEVQEQLEPVKEELPKNDGGEPGDKLDAGEHEGPQKQPKK